MTGSQDRAAPDGDRLRVGHADREQVIESLKAAFVHGQLTNAELDTRAGQALSAWTRADLAALTADLPVTPADPPPVAAPARPPALARRRPLARAAAGSGGCLVIAAAAMKIHSYVDPGATTTAYGSWSKYVFLVALAALIAAVGILVHGVVTSVEDRRSRGQLPPGPRPVGHVPDDVRPADTGHRRAPRDPRIDENRADLRAHKSRQRRWHVPARATAHATGAE